MVTGATGMTGSHTVRGLLAAGHRVRAFVRSPAKAVRVFGDDCASLELVEGDVTDRASVIDALHRCDGVVHCAAVVAVAQTGSSGDLLETNVAGVRNVIEAALEGGLQRVVHVSSLATLFRGDGSTLSEDSPPQRSQRAYGQSKTLADEYVRTQQAAGSPIKIVYPGAIIGPEDPGLSESMLALRTFVQDFIPLTTGGIQFVDARDLAGAHVRALESEPGAARYLAAGTFLRWPDLAEIIKRVTGRRPRAVPFPAPLLRGTGRLLDQLRRFVPIEVPLTAEAAAYITRWDAVPNSEAWTKMGVRFRDVSESIADSIFWLRAAGHLQ